MRWMRGLRLAWKFKWTLRRNSRKFGKHTKDNGDGVLQGVSSKYGCRPCKQPFGGSGDDLYVLRFVSHIRYHKARNYMTKIIKNFSYVCLLRLPWNCGGPQISCKGNKPWGLL